MPVGGRKRSRGIWEICLKGYEISVKRIRFENLMTPW